MAFNKKSITRVIMESSKEGEYKHRIELTAYITNGVMKTHPGNLKEPGELDEFGKVNECKLVDLDYEVDKLNLKKGKYKVTIIIEQKQ